MSELDSMMQALANLTSAFVNKTGGSQTPDAALAAARASAQAALTSATTASTQATNASNSAVAANTSKTNASASATSAATSATNASNSATSAATSATNAGNSATSASTSATNANTSNSSAQGFANRALTFAQVAPNTAYNWTDGSAGANVSATISFTAPCNGWVFAIGALNVANEVAAGNGAFNCTLYINGTNVSYDNTSLDQVHMGVQYVTKGQAVTVTLNNVVGGTATGQAASLQLQSTFFMSTQ